MANLTKFRSLKWQRLLRPVRGAAHKRVPRSMRAYRRQLLLNVVLPRVGFSRPMEIVCADIAPRLRRLIRNSALSGLEKARRFEQFLRMYTEVAGRGAKP